MNYLNVLQNLQKVGKVLSPYIATQVAETECILDCRSTRAAWFFGKDVIWKNGVYVIESCMKRCVDTAVKAFNLADKTGISKYEIAKKKVVEIAMHEVSPIKTCGQISLLVAVAAITVYCLWKRKQA